MNSGISPHDCVELYLSDLAAEGFVRPATLVTYRCHLDAFLRGCPGLPDEVGALSAKHLIAWTNKLVERGLRNGSVRAYQASVWVWCGWAYRNHYLATEIARQVRRRRAKDAEVTRRTASTDVIAKMVKVAANRREFRERNVALVLTLVATGARKSELAATELADYDRAAGTLDLSHHTKTGNPRIVGIDAQARAALDRYILTARGKQPGPLFRGRLGRPMTPEAIHCVLRSLARDAGVEASAHDFRRACAARMLEAGAHPDVVQYQLGHRTAHLTLQYGETARAKRSLAEYHALDQGIRPIRRIS